MTTVNVHTQATQSTGRSPLTDQLARRADVNRDGTVTSAEFTAFLSGLMESLDQESKVKGGEAATAPPPSVDPAPVGQKLPELPAAAGAAVDALRRAIARTAGER